MRWSRNWRRIPFPSTSRSRSPAASGNCRRRSGSPIWNWRFCWSAPSSTAICSPSRTATNNRRSDTNDKNLFIAKCLDCDGGTVSAALAEREKLRRYECLDDDFDVSRDLHRFLNGVSSEPLVNSYFQRCKEEALPWDFYGELAAKHGSMLKRILASGDGSAPINLLLYGAPGTGKTSFAKTLAAELKRDCYLIAQNTEANGNGRCTCTPAFRFGALQVCANQIEPERSIIIVDEADDMLRGLGGMGMFSLFFGGGSAPAGDKGMLNSVLDSVRVPTIWITNTPAEVLDPSSRRRFDYSVKFAPLTHAQREAIWHNNVSKLKLESLVSNDLQSQLAADYPVSAGGITLALQNLARLSPAPEEAAPLLEKLLTPHCELLGIPRVSDKLLPAKDYSLEGLNIKGRLTLPRVVEAIRNFQQGTQTGIDRPRMNLLLSGAPGTGKTEFVKYLGSILRTKVVVRMGSDLLNMYVGGTEQRIKAAFEQAEAEKAILFLDEIDGMVQTRERAQRSWEVTQVNELLHQMENFNGVMIGATNFAANLDPAVLRRFTFKLEFDYLNEAGKRHFFERMFQTSLLPEELVELAQIPDLTPGDFRTVRQSFFYLGSGVTNRERLDALRQESEGKHRQNTISGSKEKKIGF